MNEQESLITNQNNREVEFFSNLNHGKFEALLDPDELKKFNRFINSQVAFTGQFIFVVDGPTQPTWLLFTIDTEESIEEKRIVFETPDFLMPYKEGLPEDILDLPQYFYKLRS